MVNEKQAILLVDDNGDLRCLLEEWLTAEFPTTAIFHAASGEDAISILKQHQIDLVLLDIALPGMSGIEAANKISCLPSKPTIIMLTTFEDMPYREASLAAGAQAFISKRSMYRELLPTIKQFVQAA